MIHRFRLPLYGSKVTVYIHGNTKDALRAFEKKYNVEVSNGEFMGAMALELRGDGDVEFVMIFSGEATEAEIAHECLHTAWNIIALLGIGASPKNHEAQAYILGSLVENTYKAFDRYDSSRNPRGTD